MKKISMAFSLLLINSAAYAEYPQVQDACVVGSEPILEVADFNGDGLVDGMDIKIIKGAQKAGVYVAYFDRNADSLLNKEDVNIAKQDIGVASTMLDRQIANVYWSTMKYRDLGNAALKGYITATPTYKNHGRHWYYAPLFVEAATNGLSPVGVIDGGIDNNSNAVDVLGLNYDEAGNLLAVYWGMPIPFMAQVIGPSGDLATDYAPYVTPAPQIFSEPQAWHQHLGACFMDAGFVDSLQWTQGVTADICVSRGQAMSDQRGAQSYAYVHFHMLHLWVNKLNPAGKFATVNPCVAIDAPHEPNEGAYGHGH